MPAKPTDEAPPRIWLINDPDTINPWASVRPEVWKDDPKCLGEYVRADLKVKPVVVPPMPPTCDRRPFDEDDEAYDGYLESDTDWCDNNVEAVTWLIDNHAAIRSALMVEET